MIFEVSRRNFGYKKKAFSNKQVFLSTSRIGTFKNEFGEIGPVDCGSIDQNKKRAILKAFSESVERRALVIGAKGDIEEDWIQSFDLINKCISKIPKGYSKFNNRCSIISDTSGTATHFNSKAAMLNAIKELLEKNSTFLFWYGKQGCEC